MCVIITSVDEHITYYFNLQITVIIWQYPIRHILNIFKLFFSNSRLFVRHIYIREVPSLKYRLKTGLRVCVIFWVNPDKYLCNTSRGRTRQLTLTSIFVILQSFVINSTIDIIERRARVPSNSESYSGGPGFKSRPGDGLSWLTYFVVL